MESNSNTGSKSPFTATVQAFQKKWAMLKTYRRIRKLWNEYKQVAEIQKNDIKLVTEKLNEFLDSFVLSYKDFASLSGSHQINLDKLYGDCSQILLNLVELVEREAEKSNGETNESIIADLINKALNVAELILHDNKYRVVVKETPNLINRILSLLDTMKSPENQKLVLRVISALGESKENKLEIGRLDGFKKILKLLLSKDRELTREILNTIKHFLDNVSDEKKEELSHVASEVSKKTKPFLKDLLTTRIGSMLSDVTKLVVSEMHKVFSKDEDIGSDREMSIGAENSTQELSFIPTSSDIQATEEILSKPEKGMEDVSTSSMKSEEVKTNEDEILKDLMRVQGALTTLTATLQEAALTVQLDLVETISKLLFKNHENQHEFKKIDGYSFFPRLFDSITDFTSSESALFLEDCFGLFFTITLDGNKGKLVGNLDAFQLLFTILEHSTQREVKMQALRCIRDIVSVNALNVAYVRHVDGFEKLLKLMSHPSAQEPQESLFMQSVCTLLNYLGMLYSNREPKVLTMYIKALKGRELPVNSRKLILKSLPRLVSDALFRKCAIPDQLITACEFILRGEIEDYENSPESSTSLLNILEVIGMLISGNLTSFKLFQSLKLHHTIVDMICKHPTLDRDCLDTFLWILQESITIQFKMSGSSEDLKLLVNILNKETYDLLKELACYAIAELAMNESSEKVKRAIKDSGCMESLFDIIKSPTSNGLETIQAALRALGEIFTDSEENKDFLGSRIGYVAFSNVLKSSGLKLGVDSFETVLDLAFSGNIKKIIGKNNQRDYHSKTVLSLIRNILSPHPLHNKPFSCSRNALQVETVSLSSLSFSLTKESTASVAGDEAKESHSATSTRHSSFSSEEIPNIDFIESDERIEDDSPSNEKSPHFSNFSYSALGRIQLRTPECGLMLIDLLSSLDSKVHLEMLTLLYELIKSNEETKKLFCSAQSFKILLSLVNKVDSTYLPIYFDILGVLGCYNISVNEARNILDMCIDSNDNNSKKQEIQKHAVSLLCKITEGGSPSSYFSFSGFNSNLHFKMIEKLPGNKIGYSLSFWLKIKHFLADEVGLLSWRDQNGFNLFEIYFKSLPQLIGEKQKYCLCAQTQNYPSPPENIVFEQTSFEEDDVWRHLVISHSQQKITVIVDGEVVQSCGLSYPLAATKEKNLLGCIGKRETRKESSPFDLRQSLESIGSSKGNTLSDSNSVSDFSIKRMSLSGPAVSGVGYLCGELGTVHIVEGCLDEKTAFKIFASGDASELRIENRELLQIEPSTSETLIGKREDSPMSEDEVTVHTSRGLKDQVNEIGGFEAVLRLLDTSDPNLRIFGLRIVANYIIQSENNLKLFTEGDLFSILIHRLSVWNPSIDIFRILFDLMCDGVFLASKKRIIKISKCLDIIFDLLLLSPVDLQKVVLDEFSELVLSYQENLNTVFWKDGTSTGLTTVLQLLCLLTIDTNPLLLLVEKMAPNFSVEDLEIAFDFLLSDIADKEKNLQVKIEILNILYVNFTRYPVLLENVTKIGGFQVVLSILESPSEKLRILALKIVGLLIQDNPKNLSFCKNFGFHLISILLSPFPFSSQISSTLLQLCLGVFVCSGGKKSSWIDNIFASDKSKKENTKQILVYPDAIHIILDQIRSCDDYELSLQTLLDIEAVLIQENMEALWNTNWLDWMVSLSSSLQAKENTEKLIKQIYRITVKMTVYDISKKSSQEISENEAFQAKVIEGVIDYFDRNPSLPAEQAGDIVTNLTALFKHLEELDTPSVFKKVIDNINTLTYQNTSAIRVIMKNKGMLEIRDNFILKLLQCIQFGDAPISDAFIKARNDFIRSFSFESIADQRTFRETNNGILYLLHIFHLSKQDSQLQTTLYQILKNDLSAVEENRKIISNIIEDVEIASRFFNVQRSIDDPEHEEFVPWYYSEHLSKQREEIESKIQKLVSQFEVKFRNNLKTIEQRKAKKLKSRKEKLQKYQVGLDKFIIDHEEKRKQRLVKCHTNNSTRQRFVSDLRKERLSINEKKLSKSLTEDSVSKIPTLTGDTDVVVK